jgi:hypothetical protein
MSACDGWTTHEIAAHVTGIAVEVIRHLEPYLNGDPVPRTRSSLRTCATSMPCTGFHVRLRAGGQSDLRVVVENGDATLAWASDDAGEPAVDFDAGARRRPLRRPKRAHRLRTG